MRGGGIYVIAQALQHIADVNYDRITCGRDRQPRVFARKNFQPGRTGANQQGNEVDVLMRAGTHVGYVCLRDRRIVDWAQNGIAVIGFVVEIMFRQPDM